MTIEFLSGDCRDVLKTLPDKSVHCIVTSPPYYYLRCYQHNKQIGLEDTPEEYVAQLVSIFREARRVLRDDGTLWVNIGDSFSAGGQGAQGKSSYLENSMPEHKKAPKGYKPKDLLLIPFLLANALRIDGWYLRSDIIWAKKSPVPESVRDRPTKSHEHIFLLSKKKNYFYDALAIEEPTVKSNINNSFKRESKEDNVPLPNAHSSQRWKGKQHCLDREEPMMMSTRNCRDVWSDIKVTPYKAAHFALMPIGLAERCIKAGSSEHGCCSACGAPYARIVERVATGYDGSALGERAVEATGGIITGGTAKSTLGSSSGTGVGQKVTKGWEPTCKCENAEIVPCVVLDPFGGGGTTALAARNLGRDSVLIELNEDYLKIAKHRLEQTPIEKPVGKAPKKIVKREPSIDDEFFIYE